MDMIVGIFFTLVMGIFAYGSSHIVEEERRGKTIPLPWEKK